MNHVTTTCIIFASICQITLSMRRTLVSSFHQMLPRKNRNGDFNGQKLRNENVAFQQQKGTLPAAQTQQSWNFSLPKWGILGVKGCQIITTEIKVRGIITYVRKQHGRNWELFWPTETAVMWLPTLKGPTKEFLMKKASSQHALRSFSLVFACMVSLVYHGLRFPATISSNAFFTAVEI